MTNENIKYVCTKCDHIEYWSAKLYAEKGEPVCPNDDSDLVLDEQVKIKEENVIYKQVEKSYLIDFYGFNFHINKWWKQDDISSDYENDYEIKEMEQFKKLKEEKQDELKEFIGDLN